MLSLASYVPVEKRLISDPELKTMAWAMKRAGLAPSFAACKSLALGALVQLWVMGDDHCDADGVLHMHVEEIAEEVGFALIDFMPPNWIIVLAPGRLLLPDFWTKNGVPGKQRLRDASRKRAERAGRASGDAGTDDGRPSEKKPPEAGHASAENRTSDPLRSAPVRSAPSEPSEPLRPDTHSDVATLHQAQQFVEVYPPGHGIEPERVMDAARRVVRTRIVRWPQLIDAARRYHGYCDALARTGTRYVKSPITWLDEQGWKSGWDPPTPAKAPGLDLALIQQLTGGAAS